jgi:rRNA maturation endonuclease Nob1
MTKDEALKMAIEVMYRNSPKIGLTQEIEEAIKACKEALEQPAQEHNFCSRCGKRASKDLNQIHTCTPPNN